MGAVAMNCSHALRLIDLVVDGVASEEQKRLLRFHLMGCASCRTALQMTMDLSRMVGEVSQPRVPEDLLEKVRARLEADDFPPMAPVRSRFRRFVVAIPVAAAILLVLGIGAFGQRPASPAGASIGGAKMELSSTHSVDKVSYTTSPFISYSRPSTLTSF
jgi:predicted anti-sigma-YlaC factor YlaD